MSLSKLFNSLKGGPNSGFRGHAGRIGKRGGSSSTFSPITHELVNEALSKLPKAMAIENVELHKGKGPKYGGEMDAKGEYDFFTKTMHIYDVENLTGSEIQDIVFHEGGHALYNKLYDQGKLGPFQDALSRGERGITPYGGDQPSEIFAELSRVYGKVNNLDSKFLDATKDSPSLGSFFLQSLNE